MLPCYGSRLKPRVQPPAPRRNRSEPTIGGWDVFHHIGAPLSLPNILSAFCTEKYAGISSALRLALLVLPFLTFISRNVSAQETRPPFLPGATPPPSPLAPNQPLKPIRPNAPPPNTFFTSAIQQEKNGSNYILRGNAQLEATDWILKADEIEYDEESREAHARGNVRFEDFKTGEKLNASRIDYNVEDETGKFFDVSGVSPAKIDARPGILTTSNPFYFQGKWAEKLEDRYIIYDGFVTDCKVPNPWWILKGPKFDIVPYDRALAYHSWYRVRSIPVLYSPVFYRSLKKYPRQSGFLTPNIGNSSRRGKMLGIGYYWAINRSYDLMYRAQWFTERGLAHHVDFRGKVGQKTDFDFVLFGVNDKGIQIGNTIQKQGGYLLSFGARSELGKGWTARADLNYLSSFVFRQNFTESFHEAIQSETRSTAFATKHWNSFGANFVVDRDEVFQFQNTNDKVITRKLPEAEFLSRERQIAAGSLPLWVSFESSAGLLRREEDVVGLPTFSTAQFVDRLDVMPRVTTAFRWKDVSLVPSFGIRETHYGSTYTSAGQLTGAGLWRGAREATIDLGLPSLARVFKAPKWTRAEKLKHVIEPRASYRYIWGIDNAFNRLIRFDQTELWANTNEVEFSLANRLYTRDAKGNVNELLSWELTQRRYLDPTFGGAVIKGQRNVLLSAIDLTGYAFIDGPRAYSPIVSALRYNYKIGLQWRADYDPLRGGIVNSTLSADWRRDKYSVSIGYNQVHAAPVLSPSQNQFTGGVGFGNDNRRGWNGNFRAWYDYRLGVLTFAQAQVTYNTDCCGFNVQYRRFNIGTRDENQFRVAFVIANVGSFGTLKRQEAIF
jgi:LPS-assembly protein